MVEDNSVKVSNEIQISQFFYPIIFLIFSVIAEMINFVYMGFGILPKYIGFDLAIFMLGAGLIFVLPKRWMKLTVFYVFFGLQIILNCVNVTMNNIFGDILSLDMLKLGGEAASAFSFEFLDFVNILINLSLVALSILAIIKLDKKITNTTILSTKNKVALVVLAFVSIFGCCGGFFFAGKASLQEVDASTDLYIAQSDVYLWDSLFLKSEAFKKFGTYGFYYKSIENLAVNNIDETSINDLSVFVNQGGDFQNSTCYSNISSGKNLIVIMLESFEWFAIDPIYTPTLYEIRTQTGISFENFYGRNKTNVSEDISLLGSMPKNNMMIEYYNGGGINTPYSLPNLYKQNIDNSSTNFFHGYLESFYNRDIVNKAFGFDDVIALEETDIPYKSKAFGEWIKDSDFISANLEQFIPEGKNFFSFYTTIGTHGAYDNELPAYKEYYKYYDEHVNEFKEYLQTTNYIFPTNEFDYKHLRNYKSTAMDTDRMVKMLLDRLEDLNQLDNTTIVMFADHNCYYHDTTFHLKGIDKVDTSNIELYNIPFMIFDTSLTPSQNYTFCNTYDIYPTICDLFGFKYNSSLTQGYSVFSEDIENSVFVSFLNGIYNDKFFTNNVLDVIKLQENTTNQEMFKFQLNVVNFYLKQEQIEKLYKINYFK